MYRGTIIEFEEGCRCLETCVFKLTKILEEETSTSETPIDPKEYVNAYTTIYNMCTQKRPHDHSQRLYYKYQDILQRYANQKVLPRIQQKHDEYLLRELSRRWDLYKVFVKWLSHFFTYLERFFISLNGHPSLREVALKSFRDLVYREVHANVIDAVLTLIEREREGEQIDRALLRNVSDIFVECGVGTIEMYKEDFEKFLLQDTETYYARKASSWIQEDSCPEYMRKCEECLRKEKERVTHYLHSSTAPKLVETVQKALLVSVSKQLLEKEDSGCIALLRDDDKMDDLFRMYRLFNPIPKGLEPVAKAFMIHVAREGNALVKQAQHAAATNNGTTAVEEQFLVEKMIDLHEKYMVYVTDCFRNHYLFRKALKDAFESFCNKKVAERSSAELLATFCDNLFKQKSGKSAETIEATFDTVVKLLSYNSDKDLFAEFYRRKLARRLLSDGKFNEEHERSILSKMKEQQGSEYTSKMGGMVTDMEVAKEFQKFFKRSLTAKPGGIDLAVTVLNSGHWPSYKTSSDLSLPREMVACVEAFNSYFGANTNERKLTWIYCLGTCHVIANFDPQPIELVLSTYQAVVLCLFNKTERLSYKEIIEQVNLSHEDLFRVLISLSCGKHKILNKEPVSKSISTTDVFEFNSKFTNEKRRVKVSLPSMDEWTVDRKKVVEEVDKDRSYAVDASIVRIMKSRKVLHHQQLLSQCVEQLSRTFKPEIKMIKKRVEDLISREYLERDKENPSIFKYLA